MRIGKYETHPACDLFPLLGEPELSELAEDIRANGLLEPIVLYEGKILDGRNRLLACERAGVAPRFEAWTENGDPVMWLASRNVESRHMNKVQRGMVAARLVDLVLEKNRHRREAKRAWIRSARATCPPNDRQPCAVCGRYVGVSEAHHVLPLDVQHRLGMSVPNHETTWLCPTHHVAIHHKIAALLATRPTRLKGFEPEELDALDRVAVGFVRLYVAELNKEQG